MVGGDGDHQARYRLSLQDRLVDRVGGRRRVDAKVFAQPFACAGECRQGSTGLATMSQRRHENLKRALVIWIRRNHRFAHLSGS